jgi:tetratricopeptide (TPR) repeat protein
VISRTSMEKIAREKLDVREIGRRLGVSHVLEGSVRRAGDQVRVTVQLIEAGTDNHVWAENYDRRLDDVFAIQSEIALAISEQLKVKLTRKLQADLNERPTQDQAAYDLYLRAVELQRGWHGAKGFESMIALLEPAIAADPNFVAAHVMLAEAYGRLYWTGEGNDNDVAKARALVADIRKRWPDRPESTLAEAQFLYNVKRDYVAASAKFHQLQPLMPNNLAIAQGISSSAKRLDRHAEFLEASLRLLQLDPESSTGYFERVYALRVNRRLDEAAALSEEAVRKFPDDLTMRAQLATVNSERLRSLEPMLEFGRRIERSTDPEYITEVVVARLAAGDAAGALAMNGKARAGGALDQALLDSWQAELLQLWGRPDEALAIAKRSFVVIKHAVDQGSSLPRAQVALWYAQAATVALLAGERASADAWQAKAQAVPAESMEERRELDRMLARVQRLRGNIDAAWALRAKHLGEFGQLSDLELSIRRGYYDRFYGGSAAYRAHVAKLAAVR